VTDVLRLVFAKFDDLGSARQVALWLRELHIELPRRDICRPRGPLRWIEATRGAVQAVLTHPAYAGAYAYGRQRTVRQIAADGTVRQRAIELPGEEWSVLIRDHHPGLIDWRRYEQIGQRLKQDRTHQRTGPGPAREGVALLQGLAYCGRCGRRMAVAYNGRGRRFGQFLCRQDDENRGSSYFCQTVGGRRIETAVVELVLDAVEPAGVEVALRALESIQQEQEQLACHWRQRIEHAEYEAELARGRYEAVDVANRLVSVELERRWNEALASAQQVRREAEVERRRRGEPTRVTDDEVVKLARKLAVEGGLDDTQITRVLSKRNARTATGLTFTKLRVQDQVEPGRRVEHLGVRIGQHGMPESHVRVPQRRRPRSHRAHEHELHVPLEQDLAEEHDARQEQRGHAGEKKAVDQRLVRGSTDDAVRLRWLRASEVIHEALARPSSPEPDGRPSSPPRAEATEAAAHASRGFGLRSRG